MGGLSVSRLGLVLVCAVYTVVWPATLPPGPPGATPVYHIAVILPDSNNGRTKRIFSRQRVSPAIDIALENIRENTSLTSEFAISVEHADSKCDISESINQAFNFYMRHEVNVFFGPCCDYAAAPIARQINFWNLPMVTTGAMAFDFGMMKQGSGMYHLLTRTGPTINSLVDFLVDLMKQFKWRHLKQVFEPLGQPTVEKLCHFTADGLHNHLIRNPQLNLTEEHKKLLDPKDHDSLLRKDIGNSNGGQYARACACSHTALVNLQNPAVCQNMKASHYKTAFLQNYCHSWRIYHFFSDSCKMFERF